MPILIVPKEGICCRVGVGKIEHGLHEMAGTIICFRGGISVFFDRDTTNGSDELILESGCFGEPNRTQGFAETASKTIETNRRTIRASRWEFTTGWRNNEARGEF